MYPKLSDLINDLFGTNINLPIQSYGFFLALAFLTGAWIIYLEFGRKEREGILSTTTKKVTRGKPASAVELLVNFVVSFIVGFKFSGFVLDYSTFVENPQEYITSGAGSWVGGILLAAAYTGYYYYTKEKKKLPKPITEEVEVHPKEHALPILFIAVIAGILGAKVFHWFENWDEFTRDPLGSLVSFSGLTFYGGLIVALISVLYYGERHKIGWRYLTDAAAPALILAYGIGRIGCQISGDGDWGIVNTAPKPGWLSYFPDWIWAYDYPHNVINSGVLIPGCTGEHCFRLAETVYPTPIYETTMAVIIFSILWSTRKSIKVPGALFAIYLMFNGLERFLIEKIRINNVFDFLGMQVTQAEVISTGMFIGGLGLLIYFYRSASKATA
jgi:prolipoprotein diacylglyceryltransferase